MNFVWTALLASTTARPAVSPGFLSGVLGDHMVLQRAPGQAVLWGRTAAGATVTTTFNGSSLTAVASGDGSWRQRLAPVPGSRRQYTLTFKSSAGDQASLSDILFGDVCEFNHWWYWRMPAVHHTRSNV